MSLPIAVFRVAVLAALAAMLPVLPVDAQMAHNHIMQGQAPKQPGQGAFAAIQEIVELLEADPSTDWSKVNINALRQHLVDMNAVTLLAEVEARATGDGIRFVVTGHGSVVSSIRRMVAAHALTMDRVDGWNFAAEDVKDGAALTVQVPAADLVKLKALGFFGVMVHGMHHQAHHLVIARGGNPHHH